MKLITNDNTLRKYITHAFATVEGEPSLFDILTPYLEQAEEWVKTMFTSETTFNTISGYQDSNPVKPITTRVVVCHAFLMAVPSLDLVLTPNGFGVVSNQTVAPASKDRVDRLIASLERERDAAIELLLPRLPYASKWVQSQQYDYFVATLFPNFSLCRRLAIREHLWAEYQALHDRLIKIEQVLEQTYFSHEQMQVFREKALRQLTNTHPLEEQVIRQLQSLLLMLVSDMQVHPQSFYDLVNIIRQHEDIFPEWHTSSVAQLYTPTIFNNRKTAGGYWF